MVLFKASPKAYIASDIASTATQKNQRKTVRWREYLWSAA